MSAFNVYVLRMEIIFYRWFVLDVEVIPWTVLLWQSQREER